MNSYFQVFIYRTNWHAFAERCKQDGRDPVDVLAELMTAYTHRPRKADIARLLEERHDSDKSDE